MPKDYYKSMLLFIKFQKALLNLICKKVLHLIHNCFWYVSFYNFYQMFVFPCRVYKVLYSRSCAFSGFSFLAAAFNCMPFYLLDFSYYSMKGDVTTQIWVDTSNRMLANWRHQFFSLGGFRQASSHTFHSWPSLYFMGRNTGLAYRTVTRLPS